MGGVSAAVVTASWSACYQADKDRRLSVLPVRTSLGVPKFWPRAADFPAVQELMPDGWMMRLDDASFERAYRAKLDRIGVEAIRSRLALIAGVDGPTLALCCFEKDAAACHRRQFAEWWREQTGQHVPEMEPVQPTTDQKEAIHGARQ